MLEANGAPTPTLSLKDAQRCFDKERRAFLRDLETLRQQLVRKDQQASKAAAAASAHTIQLKRELSSLQAALQAAETSRDDYRAKFAHASSLLETAMDQHQEDQSKLADMTETLRTLERRHEEAMTLVKKEAATSVTATLEERKALRARVDQLRCKIDKERKDWQTERRPLTDELAKARARLAILEKELNEARFRESSSFQLREKMAGEVNVFKRKLEDTASALQESLAAKSEMRSEHILATKRAKQKLRELLESHQHTKNQLLMLQEDYNGLFRTRTCVEQQNARLYETIKQMKLKHEDIVKCMERERWELEKQHKKASVTCSTCLKTPEARIEDETRKLEAAREQTRLQVAKDMELERWDRFQEVNAKYITACEQLQVFRQQGDDLRSRIQRFEREKNELITIRESLEADLKASEESIEANANQAEEATKQLEEAKKTLQTLMDNVNNLTIVTADQSKQLQELEAIRKQEREKHDQDKSEREEVLSELRESHDALKKELEEFREQYEILKREKARHWNEIVEAQLSANLLIEEQAHTIDDLLKTKLNEMSPTKNNGQAPSATSSPTPTPVSGLDASPLYVTKLCLHPQQVSSSPLRQPLSYSPGSSDTNDVMCTVATLRGERDALESALHTLEMKFQAEKAAWSGEFETRTTELQNEVAKLQAERSKLKRRLDEQAVTIHELTLQEDEDEDQDDEHSDCASEFETAPMSDHAEYRQNGRHYDRQDYRNGRTHSRRRESSTISKHVAIAASPDRFVNWQGMKESSISRGELSFRSGGS